jgi:hypothetical protein
MNGLRDGLLSALLAENPLIDPLILFGLKMGFGNVTAIIRLAVQGSGEPETAMSALLENVGPFIGFKGYAVRTCKACRDKSDIFAHSNKTRPAMLQKVRITSVRIKPAST